MWMSMATIWNRPFAVGQWAMFTLVLLFKDNDSNAYYIRHIIDDDWADDSELTKLIIDPPLLENTNGSYVTFNTADALQCTRKKAYLPFERQELNLIYTSYSGLIEVDFNNSIRMNCSKHPLPRKETIWVLRIKSALCAEPPVSLGSKQVPPCADWTAAENGAYILTKLWLRNPRVPFNVTTIFNTLRQYRIVYNSSTEGYISYPFVPVVHAVHYPKIYGMVDLLAPRDHWILLSTACGFYSCNFTVDDFSMCIHRSHLVWLSGKGTTRRIVKKKINLFTPASSLQRAERLRLWFPICTDTFIDMESYRIVFSYHNISSVPTQLPNGQWNCSVPLWPNFDVHFRCNLVKECIHGEDEMECPYNGHCGHGKMAILDHCYMLIRGIKLATLQTAKGLCKDQGGYLASVNTPLERDELRKTFMSMLTFSNFPRALVGLQRERVLLFS